MAEFIAATVSGLVVLVVELIWTRRGRISGEAQQAAYQTAIGNGNIQNINQSITKNTINQYAAPQSTNEGFGSFAAWALGTVLVFTLALIVLGRFYSYVIAALSGALFAVILGAAAIAIVGPSLWLRLRAIAAIVVGGLGITMAARVGEFSVKGQTLLSLSEELSARPFGEAIDLIWSEIGPGISGVLSLQVASLIVVVAFASLAIWQAALSSGSERAGTRGSSLPVHMAAWTLLLIGGGIAWFGATGELTVFLTRWFIDQDLQLFDLSELANAFDG